tara:strand:- start:19 stop:621 length:603 start_codon:yes stop_codon:yes gene_type:complete
MTAKECLKQISKNYEKIRKYVFWVENRNFPQNDYKYSQDATQELFLKLHTLLEYEESVEKRLQIVDTYSNLKSYSIYRVVLQIIQKFYAKDKKYVPMDFAHMSKSDRETFLRNYTNLSVSNFKEIESKDSNHILLKEIDSLVDSFYWFDRKLYRLYLYEFKTHKTRMSKETKLSRSTIYRAVKRCEVKIKSRLNKSYNEK